MAGRTDTKTLPPEMAERVRKALVEFVASAGGQKAAGVRLGVSQQHVGRMVRAVQPDVPGVHVAMRLAEALGITYDTLTLGIPPPGANRAPTFGSLPGWPEAETEARRRYRYIPEKAWVGARGLMGAADPGHGQITYETVRRGAELWLDLNTRPEETPEDRARDDELSRMHEELEAAKKARQDAKPSAVKPPKK